MQHDDPFSFHATCESVERLGWRIFVVFVFFCGVTAGYWL